MKKNLIATVSLAHLVQDTYSAFLVPIDYNIVVPTAITVAVSTILVKMKFNTKKLIQ